MARRKKPQGFGSPADQPAYNLHPHSFDLVVLDLARHGGKRMEDTDDDTPEGTLVWQLFDDYRSAHVSCIGEDWDIELTLCTCCPGIKGWVIRHFNSFEPRPRGGFIQFGSDDWDGIERAIDAARALGNALVPKSF